jgi:serine/threonine protein kinase
MAPEQFQASPVRASDQYSLGIIVYEWLTGTPPFRGSWKEVALKHLNEPPPSLRGKVPDLPAEVEGVVLRALEKNPKNRFETCKAFVDALERASGPPVGTTVLTFTGHSDRVTALAWSPDGARIASASNDQTIQVWDAGRGSICIPIVSMPVA